MKHARTRAYRRAQRKRMRRRAERVVNYSWRGSTNPDRWLDVPVYKLADNLTTCSCSMCRPGAASRQIFRWLAKCKFEESRV